MTFYAGEEFRFAVVPTGFDGTTVLGSDAVGGVAVTIYNSANTAVVTSAAMTWDADHHEWFYLWDTTGLPAGSYKAKVLLTDLVGAHSWEWKRIRLARDLVS